MGDAWNRPPTYQNGRLQRNNMGGPTQPVGMPSVFPMGMPPPFMPYPMQYMQPGSMGPYMSPYAAPFTQGVQPGSDQIAANMDQWYGNTQGHMAARGPASGTPAGAPQAPAAANPRVEKRRFTEAPPPRQRQAEAWPGGYDRHDPYHRYYKSSESTLVGSGRNGAATTAAAAGTIPSAKPAAAAPERRSQHKPQQQQQQQQQQAGNKTDFDREHAAGSLEDLSSRTSSHGAVYTRLTQNISELVGRLDADEEDVAHRNRVLHVISEAMKYAFPEFPNAQVKPFGSFVSGLGTKESDMDLVITGMQEPPDGAGFYESRQRPFIARLLDRASTALFRFPELRGMITKHFVIRTARMPVARITFRSGLVVDLSIAGSSGPDAAKYLARQVAAWPALRPLTLTVKAYFKTQGLNDVSTGGLSSYGITYMVLAHLQEEAKAKSDTKDLGYMLLRFFQRYCTQFDPCKHAIAVGYGGIVTRSAALYMGADYFKNPDRIATVDPLTGRDCTEGCYQTQMVLTALEKAERYLSAVVIKHQDRSMSSLAKVDLLQGLISPVDLEDDEDDYYATQGDFKRQGSRSKVDDGI